MKYFIENDGFPNNFTNGNGAHQCYTNFCGEGLGDGNFSYLMKEQKIREANHNVMYSGYFGCLIQYWI